MITAWSYSRYALYTECPFKAKCKFVLRLTEPGSPAMDRGAAIHEKTEKYLSGSSRKLPPEIKSLEAEYKAIKKLKPEIELELAFTKDWKVTSWFGKDVWCRVKVDALIPPVVGKSPTVQVIDHKTGSAKEPGKYAEQLDLYGVAGLTAFPIADVAKPRLLFVDHGIKIEGDPLVRKDLEKARKRWEIRVKSMLADKTFKPRPGNYCRWCHFRKDNGGPCTY